MIQIQSYKKWNTNVRPKKLIAWFPFPSIQELLWMEGYLHIIQYNNCTCIHQYHWWWTLKGPKNSWLGATSTVSQDGNITFIPPRAVAFYKPLFMPLVSLEYCPGYQKVIRSSDQWHYQQNHFTFLAFKKFIAIESTQGRWKQRSHEQNNDNNEKSEYTPSISCRW